MLKAWYLNTALFLFLMSDAQIKGEYLMKMQPFHIKLPRADRILASACPQRILGRRRGAKWHYAAPPDGQWARPEP